MRVRTLLACTTAIVGSALACSDVRLEFPDQQIDQNVVDNQLQISGDFCTSPASDVDFPVKIMFIVDGSGSQQFSDQNRQRVVAVEETINSLIGGQNTFFKVIVFNASISATPSTTDPNVFTDNPSDLYAALTKLAEADTLTDYQGALAVAYNELTRDMVSVEPAERARTKYVVIMISDGLPDPQCTAGLCNDTDPNFPNDPNCGGIQTNKLCEDQSFLNCLLCNGVSGNDECDTLRAQGAWDPADCFAQPDAADLFGGLANTELAGGNDYNQPYQILQKVQDIMDLAERWEVGELRVHSGLVLDPRADPAVIAVFGDASQAIPLMEQIGELGNGRFLQFYGGDSIDFLSLNFDSLKQTRVIRGFYATNTNAQVGMTGLQIDSDGDGLVDALEHELRYDALNGDSDGDGFSDYLEWKLSGFGFDAVDKCFPPISEVVGIPAGSPCDPDDLAQAPFNCEQGAGGYADDDLDGLHNCEERQIGTDPRNPDTDADGLPDQIDFMAGLDPLRWDVDRDDDQDGLPNGREIEWHLNPLVEQTDRVVRERYRYDRPETGTTVDGAPCFDFDVRHITLVPSADTGFGIGHNQIRVLISENMADDMAGVPLYRIACVNARYVPPSLKQPLGGQVTLLADDFGYLANDRDGSLTDPSIIADLYDPNAPCLFACTDSTTCPAGLACDDATNLCR